MPLPVALQLYSVRDALADDPRGTLRKIREMGYQGVELSGLSKSNDPYEVSDPYEIKQILDETGLKAVSGHALFKKMLNDPVKAFSNFIILGCRYICIPWLDKYKAFTNENFKRTAEDIIYVGKAAKESGLILLYHNHYFEFAKINVSITLENVTPSTP